jgi:hypothetical protein
MDCGCFWASVQVREYIGDFCRDHYTGFNLTTNELSQTVQYIERLLAAHVVATVPDSYFGTELPERALRLKALECSPSGYLPSSDTEAVAMCGSSDAEALRSGEDVPERVAAAKDQPASMETHISKKLVRRNSTYEKIDEALREISEARPMNHEEVFRFLDGRKVLTPNRKPFKAAGGWLKGFEQSRHSAGVWLSQAWTRLGLPPFARGPKVVSETTLEVSPLKRGNRS